MIPMAYLQQWSAFAPWPDLRQIEQDLIICRALCDLFSAPKLAGRIAFRGGTAINKLLFEQPLRYSEDIDLVQTHPEAIGETLEGKPISRAAAEQRMLEKLSYSLTEDVEPLLRAGIRYESEDAIGASLEAYGTGRKRNSREEVSGASVMTIATAVLCGY
jgi:hypothetical protein